MDSQTKETKPKKAVSKKKGGNHKAKTYLKESARQTRLRSEPNLLKSLEKKIIAKLTAIFTRHQVRKPYRREKNSPGSLSSIMVGINAVTRSIEKSSASLVFVNGSTQPAILTDHLYIMAFQKSLAVPLITLRDAQPLCQAMNLTSLNAFAFKKLSEYDGEFQLALETVINMLPDEVFERSSRKKVLTIDSNEKTTEQSATEANVPETVPVEFSESEPPTKKLKLEETEIFPSLMDKFRENCEIKITLPPDDVPFASMYTFKKELSTSSTPDFIAFSEESYNIGPVAESSAKRRYHQLVTAIVKENPNRKKKE